MKCDCSPINILIVEDNPGDVRLIKEILGEYRIINGIDWAMDGEEALNKIREGNYHLVIMDMHLPRMNGMEIINAIKSNNECSLTKFAIMAGDGSQDRPPEGAGPSCGRFHREAVHARGHVIHGISVGLFRREHR